MGRVSGLWLALSLLPAACGAIALVGLQGHFYSPGYPQGYPDDVSQTWEIRVPPGYGIRLRFAHVDIERSADCAYDYLQIFADEELSPPVCGTSSRGPRHFPFPLDYWTSGNWMSVTFTSDFSNDQRYTGFSAHYSAVDIDECTERGVCAHFCNNYIGGYFCGCRPAYHLLEDGIRCGVNCSGQTFTRFKGEFASPNHPLPYAENSQCHYRIQIEPGFQLILRFVGDFHVEGDPRNGCRADVLKIKSGKKEYGPFCGDQVPGLPEHLENTVDVTFVTDGTGEVGGWKIKYHSTAKQCPTDILEHAVVSPRKKEYDYQDTVWVHCEKGYEILDVVHQTHPPSVLIYCQRDGTWNTSSIGCVPINCGNPLPLRNGHAKFTSTLFRSRNVYTCEEPYYSLKGPGVFECSENAEWVDITSRSPAPPKCEPVCGPCHAFSGAGRIFGGSRATPGQLPWQVRLRRGSGVLGGGALVAEGWVLTAAHVVETSSPLPVIYAGLTNLRQRSRESELVTTEVHRHPDYQPQRSGAPNYDNDVALVKLRDRVKMGPLLAPLCLPGPGETDPPLVGTLGLIAGWGKTENLTHRSPDLLWARVPVVDMGLCSRADYGGRTPVFTGNMICAGQPGTDSCQGDSGGAYVFRDPGGKCVGRGLVSFGPPKCGSYGVYTHLGKYADWVRNVMKNHSDWEEN